MESELPRSVHAALRTLVCAALGALPAFAATPTLFAQTPEAPRREEQVSYRNPVDSTYLTASLTLPAGTGPHAGVVLLSIAGSRAIVDRLVRDGYAVLIPMRRGFVEVEPLLRATYHDLALDAQAAVEYLRGRSDVADGALAIVAQADDAPPAMIASAESGEGLPLVLLAPPGFPGREIFRLEQRGLAERDGARAAQLQALDAYVGQISDIVLSESSTFARSNRLRALRASTPTRLPYNAAFPSDELQVHFFSSPLWHDRIAFDPEQALARLSAPVLVLIGSEDVNTPMIEYLTAMRRGLAAAPTTDSGVCRLPGRARHTHTAESVDAVAEWLAARVPRGSRTTGERREPRGCLGDPPGA